MGHTLHRVQMYSWCHPDTLGGERIRFASDDDAWQALRQNWPELALPVLPRIVVDERDQQDEPAKPFSDASFRELAQVNPTQAAWSRAMLEQASTARRCAVCGDTEEVNDYLVTSSDCARMLTRLCADCRAIQAMMYDLRTGPALPLPPDEAVP